MAESVETVGARETSESRAVQHHERFGVEDEMKRCLTCGLANFDDAMTCRRCNRGLSAPDVRSGNSGPMIGEIETLRARARGTSTDYDGGGEGVSPQADHSGENRAYGAMLAVLGGLLASCPWLLLHYAGRVLINGAALAIAVGAPVALVGLGVLMTPPRTPLSAKENRKSLGGLVFVGLLFSALEAIAFLLYTGAL
jgi:hypothetical protein